MPPIPNVRETLNITQQVVQFVSDGLRVQLLGAVAIRRAASTDDSISTTCVSVLVSRDYWCPFQRLKPILSTKVFKCEPPVCMDDIFVRRGMFFVVRPLTETSKSLHVRAHLVQHCGEICEGGRT